MWRNKTVNALIREHRQREARLLTQVDDLLDRLMHAVDKTWVPPPAELPAPEPPDDNPVLYAVEQLIEP